MYTTRKMVPMQHGARSGQGMERQMASTRFTCRERGAHDDSPQRSLLHCGTDPYALSAAWSGRGNCSWPFML
eukprot:CAMPEP_0119413922 /NCGR_PEP_ID=MMETSP1335-20130426/6234_1 /TAXON_ID=259385 /ORGANISM="Chrysoculter rhomboideus, Strain RCC1486" /LENGTH=71 /DNA_ID=CAMNT_0007438755 /DNA_START=456 /DNA_END=671 /DNA_ORIENTATION=+